MTVANIQVAVDDPSTGFAPERVDTADERFFLDGPVSARVAVVDRDSSTGKLHAPVRWDATTRTYSTGKGLPARPAIAACAFGLVLETMSMFEASDVLGRKVTWAFDAPQLLVVPDAGIWANAFYSRSSRSLQFFSFDAPDGHRVRTALSRDIVTHETGHAILDGIAPALYDALTPQTLALHEAIADLTGICMSLRSRGIRQWFVDKHGGSLKGSTPASQIANEFGDALRRHHPLRDAKNDMTVAKAGDEPHDLSQVLSGAVWSAMGQLHESALDRARADPKRDPEESVEERAL